MDKESLFSRAYGCLAGGVIGDAMGAPVEGWSYKKIEEKLGEVSDFSGTGTDDSAIRLILCDAILQNEGYVTADEFAASFLRNPQYLKLFYIPVRNMYHKIKEGFVLPVYAGLGNMQSSSSAMAISPMGIINACNPRQAAVETYDVAGLIHAGETSTFCRDGACVIAAAIAEAMSPQATVDSILEASMVYLHKKSSALMFDEIKSTLQMAKTAGNYKAFRQQFYETNLQNLEDDSRETVPVVLAIFYLAGGDPVKCIINGVNFGRDADTIGTMVGGIAGAYRGISGLKPEWVAKLEEGGDFQKELAKKLVVVARNKAGQTARALDKLNSLK